MTFLLRILQAPGGVPEAGARRLDPGAGPLTIGRGSDSDWMLPDPERHISKVHCRIEPGADGLYLVDLSSNGVFLATEARPVGRGNRRALDAGDSFRIGDYRIGVAREAPEGSPGVGDAPAPVAVGISAILDGTSEGHEQRAARSLSAPASDWLATVPGGAAEAQVVLPYGWQGPPATDLTELPEAQAESVSDFAGRSEHVAPINEALHLAEPRVLLPSNWNLGTAAGSSPSGTSKPAEPDWAEACATLIEGTGLGGLARQTDIVSGAADRDALVRAGQLLRRLVDVLATVEAVQRTTERDLGLAERPSGADLPGLVADLIAAGDAESGDRLVARLADVARDARALGVAVAEAADAVGAQIQPEAIEDAAREGTRLAVGPLLKAACWERYAAVHANLTGGAGAADAVLATLRRLYGRSA
ncbi:MULTISPECIES: FHA domain-containing protein [unclassified Methylobacterium]|uniref:FHA domain-containing protein n=1 Tax=unclassified Methylobacterium TaxID=2615210 RepID=UPI003702B1A4